MSKPASITSIIFMMSFFVVSEVSAAQYQQCLNGSSCQIGEFLYDDNYSPLTGASCTLNTKDPSGTTVFNNIAMTGNSDGWYSYSFTTPSTLGVYRSQVCCNASGDYLCIDKSFEVTASTEDVADAVWSNSGRSNFISEIWGYSSDSLGSFASKITSIFNRSESIENNTNNLENQINNLDSDVQNAQNSTQNSLSITQNIISGLLSDNRELLEQIINAPVIQNFIDEEKTVPLSEKVTMAESAVNKSYATTQTIKAKLTSLLSKWSTLTATKIEAELEAMIDLIGTTAHDASNDSLMGELNTLLSGWDSPIIVTTGQTASSLATAIVGAQGTLEEEGTASTSFQDSLLESLEVVASLEENIGDASDSLASITLFGFLRKIQSSADSFGNAESDIDQLIKNFSQFSDKEISNEVSKLQSEVLGANQIRGAESLLRDPINPDNPHPKFTLYGLKGIISLNRAGVATSAKNPISDIWLQDQENFMIVRGYIYNPSENNLTREIKYALPIEITDKEIIGTSDNITVAYDASQAIMVAEGKVPLSGGELTTFHIQLKDIWALSDTNIESYKTQAQDLVNSLRKTAQYPQANAVKSDIEVTLDKIKIKLAGNFTPESRIKAVRDAQLDLLSVQEKLNTLKGMVTESASAKSIVGAVGGVQAVAVWGLILIFVSGFVFLVVFMRRMQPVAAGVGIRRSVIAHPINLSAGHDPVRVRVPRMPIRATDFAPSIPAIAPAFSKIQGTYGKLIMTIVMTIGLATIVVGLITRTSPSSTQTVPQTNTDPKLQSQGIQLSPTQNATAQHSLSDKAPNSPVQDSILGVSSTEMMLNVGDKSAEVLSSPSATAKKVMVLTESQLVYIFEVKKDLESGISYSRIGFSADDDTKNWWVETSLLSSTE